MSQYSTGLSSVTNNSPTVTGTNTLWLANVTAGDSFTIASTGVMYNVASVDSDTQVTLSAPYAGVTASGVVYAIGTGFTVPDSFPEMSQGDIETATIFTRAMRKIQSKFTGIAINTTAEIGQAVSDHVALADPHSQYADQANTYTETEVDELTGSFAYPNTTLASSSDISVSVNPAIAAYPHIQGFRTGTGTDLTFAQVVEEAAELGARLLTIQELEANVAAQGGFSYDDEITWTSSPAGVGLVYGNIGRGDGTRVVLNTSTDTAAGGYAVSVIGQRQWTDTQYAGLDGGADANFTAMPQVGGDPIVESGSNADGEWTRWSDGTMTQFGTRTNSIDFTNAQGDFFRNFGSAMIITLPLTFFGTVADYSSSVQIGGADFQTDAVELIGSQQAAHITTSEIRAIFISQVSATETLTYAFQAIGRWK